MTATIKVWPTKATAVGMVHPHGPPLIGAGAEWPDDSFTARRLRDGSASLDEADVHKVDEHEKAPHAESVRSDALGTAEGRSSVDDIKAG